MKLAPLLLLLVLLAPSVRAAAQASGDFAAVDAFVAERWGETNSPALAYAVVRDGVLAHTGGLGDVGDGSSPSADTPFAIGSMTKSFTALAVLQLVDTGRVGLDAPVQRYLPWFRVADPEASARITVRQLLSNTSGIPTSAGFWRGDAEDGNLLERRVRALASQTLFAAPGTAYAYSNANFDIAGLIVQTTSGRPYDAYIAEQILAPLGMVSSGFQMEGAQGHQDWFGLALPAAATVNGAMWPAGGLYSSAADMARYLAAQLDAGRGPNPILSTAGFAALHRPADVGDAGYALGWDTEQIVGVPMVEHGGASPAFNSSMLFAPDQGLGVVVLSNLNTPGILSEPLATTIAAGILALLVGEQPTTPGFAGVRTGLTVKYALLALTVWGLVQMPLELRRMHKRLGTGSMLARISPSVLINFALGLFLLLWLPPLLGTPLWAMLEFNPDVACLLVIGAAGSLLSATLQGTLVATRGRG
jgi:CubicO group peptidase (beta-lactamase class C family)